MNDARESRTTLLRNLDALDHADPDLARRLRLPSNSPLVCRPDGRWAYRVQHALHDLRLDAGEVTAALAEVPRTEQVLSVGVGDGELVTAMLASDRPRVRVWDRDPAMLRHDLARFDRADDLARGRLRLALGTDLLDLPRGMPVVLHPRFETLYADELDVYQRGEDGMRACLGLGGLLVESLARHLRARGHRLWNLDLQGLAPEELDLAVRRFQPEFLLVVNYTEGLAEFCQERELSLACWEIDPALAPPRRLTRPAPRARVFTYREANVDAFRRAGFEHVEHLPLAADPHLRRPVDVRADRPVSFVGSSMVSNARDCRQRFEAVLATWMGEPSAGQVTRSTDELLAAARRDLDTYTLPTLIDKALPGLREAWSSGDLDREDPLLLLSEVNASERRLSFLARLGKLRPHVWGDAGWRAIEPYGVVYEGPAGHGDSLTRIYCSSRVNLDVGRLFQADIVTLRVFDILASGGFVLAEHNAELERLFDIGTELESHSTSRELSAKARFYAEHPDEAREIAARGRDAVLERHTIEQRLDHILASI